MTADGAMDRGEQVITDEWRRWMRETKEDLEVMTRVRDKLLKQIDDMRAEFSAKEAELKLLRERVRKLEAAEVNHE